MGQNLIPDLEDEPTRVVATHTGQARPLSGDGSGPRPALAGRSSIRHIDSEAPTRPVGPQPVTAPESYPQPGELFQGFELLSELGRGGMGRVFLARQRALASRLVVVKVGPHLSRECQKLAKLQHPNIVPIYSFHQEGGTQAVCMPYRGPLTLAHLVAKLRTEDLQTIDGKALTTMIEECRRGREPSVSPPTINPTPVVPPAAAAAAHPEVRTQDRANQMFANLRGLNYIDAVLTIVRQVADGLRFAHDKRIVHCDLKPANVLISDDGCPQLIDFGIAFDKSNLAVEQFRVGGTRPYMSPEQLTSVASEHMEYDERSDLYGVGVILYELVTGELPFEPNFVSTPAAIENDCMNRFKPPVSPRSLNPRVPLAVEAIIAKCLAPEVAKRYQTARELHEDLDRQLARKPLRFAANPSQRELAIKWSTRNRLLLVAAGFAAVMGITAAGVAYRDARRAELDAQRAEQALLLEALAASEPFTTNYRDAQFFFGLADTDSTYRPRAWESARKALDFHHAWDDELWFTRTGYRSLPPEQLSIYRHQAASLMLLLANSELQQASRMPVGPSRSTTLQRASEWSRRAEATDPDPEGQRAIWLQRAALARLSGNTTEAERVLSKAQAIPRDVDDSVPEGRELMAEGRIVDAQRLFKEAIHSDPRNFWAVFNQASCAQRLGQDWEAVAGFDICVSLQPRFAGTYFNRGQIRSRLARFEEAQSDFNRVIELRPDWADTYFFRALTKEAQRHYHDAIADLNRALELGFTPTSVYLVRSRVQARLGDHAAALRDRTEGLKLEPTDERGWLARAQAKLIDDVPGALSDYNKALEMNPRSVIALQGRGHLLARSGDIRAAVEALSRIVEINPDSADAWSGRGVLHARLNDCAAAHRDARQALLLTQRAATKYAVAGIYAVTSQTQPNDRREALAMLDAALRAGFGFEYLDQDRELDPIRSDPEFKKTVEAARSYRNSMKKID